MTKINKLGKSTFVIAILSFILVAVLAFGGTYAYFSAVSGRAAGTLKTGHLSLTATGDIIDTINGFTVANNTIVQPGQNLVGTAKADGTNDPDTLTAVVNTNINYYIRVKFDVDITTGEYVNGEWKAKPDKAHNGVITPDDLLTPKEENDEETNDNDIGEGDNVLDDISILEITLGVTKDQVAETWAEYTIDQGAGKAVQHTGYFYPELNKIKKTYTAAQNALGIPVDHTYNMTVLINVQDWVGAHGCTYYMDAGIEIRFQIEILQADYLDHTKWTDAPFTGPAGPDSNPTPATIKELHDAWDKAVNLAQTV